MLPNEAAALPLRRGLIQSNTRGRVVILRKTNGGSYHLVSVEVDARHAHGVETKQESLKGFMRHIQGTENLVAERVTFSLTPPYDERKHYQPYRVLVDRPSSQDTQRFVDCTSSAFETLLREIAIEQDNMGSSKRNLTAPLTGVLITVQQDPKMLPYLHRWRLPRILEALKGRNTLHKRVKSNRT